MIYSSLAVLAMSASALVSPLANPLHLHPKMPSTDTRINLSLYNKANMFRDVQIDGHVYTVLQHGVLHIKAPAGTLVIAASRTPHLKRGDVMFEITPQVQDKKLVME